MLHIATQTRLRSLRWILFARSPEPVLSSPVYIEDQLAPAHRAPTPALVGHPVPRPTPLTHFFSTLTEDLVSVDSNGLPEFLSPLSTTLTQKRGRGQAPVSSPV